MHFGIVSHIQWMMECLNHSAFFAITLASLLPPPLPLAHIHSTLPVASLLTLNQSNCYDLSALQRNVTGVTYTGAVQSSPGMQQ